MGARCVPTSTLDEAQPVRASTARSETVWMNIKTVSLLAVLALTGCASSSVLVGTQRAPIDPSQVRIYLDPPPNYEKVALLDAGSRNSWAITDQGKTNKVMERLKAEAAELGANGILIGGLGDQQIGSVG